MRLDDVFPRLDAISDTEAETILSAAKSDRTFRLQLAGVFVGSVAAVGLFSLAIPVLYRTYHLGFFVKLFLVVLTLAGIWQSVKLVRRVVEHFYCSAIMRQAHARTAGGA